MIHFFPSWGATQSPSGPQTGSSSFFGETVVAVALTALGFLTANAFDYTNPGLATLIRLTTGGLSLIWLFGRCCPSGSSTPHVVHHHVTPVPVHVPPPQPQTSSSWNWFSLPTMHSAPAVRPMVTPHNPHGGGFPTVYKAPPQPDLRPMYQAPVSRDPGFNPTHPIGFSGPPQATTTHTSFPQVKPIPAQVKTGPTGLGGFPTVYKAPPQQTGSFPTVHRVPAQADSTPMFKAAESRTPTGFPPPSKVTMTAHSSMPFTPMMPGPAKTMGGFPMVHKAPPQQTGGFPNVDRSQPQHQSGHPGNDRLLFKAAEKRI